MTEQQRSEIIVKLLAIIEWTLVDGQLKSLDHRVPKRLAEEALRIVDQKLESAFRAGFEVAAAMDCGGPYTE